MVDQKKVQSLIQGVLVGQAQVESAINTLNDIKTKYQNHAPSLEGSNLSSQDVTDFNSYLNDINQLQIDHAAIINKFKNKDYPSHGTECLD